MKKEDKCFQKRIDSCFGSNDVRCVVGSELNSELAYKIGRSFVKYIRCKKVIVGRDLRKSSELIKDSFIQGVIDEGASVLDVGIIDSPGLYFASGKLNLAGAMITASHNPPKYNGIKFVNKGAIPIGKKAGLDEIKNLLKKDNFSYDVNRKGKVREIDISKKYRKHILSFINKNKFRKIKIIVDAGNGVASKMAPIIFRKLPVEFIGQDLKMKKGIFHYGVDPSRKKNVKNLRKKVLEKKADIGIAFDGDMDRVFFVDEVGKIIDSSVIASLLISHLFKNKKGSVVYNTPMSKIVRETIKRMGLKGFRERVGHSFIKSKMRKTKSDFGCENSSHFYYKDNYYSDSGMISALIICRILSDFEGTFSQMVIPFQKYAKSKEKSIKVRDREKGMNVIEKKYGKKAKRFDKLDGITMEFKDWWFNLRKSNTEPFLRLNIEADNELILREKLKEVTRVIKKSDSKDF